MIDFHTFAAPEAMIEEPETGTRSADYDRYRG